jgi:hypothetical protein
LLNLQNCIVMHVFVCYQLTTDLFDHVLYWGLAVYLVPPVTDWQIDGMQMYVNVNVVTFMCVCVYTYVNTVANSAMLYS